MIRYRMKLRPEEPYSIDKQRLSEYEPPPWQTLLCPIKFAR